MHIVSVERRRIGVINLLLDVLDNRANAWELVFTELFEVVNGKGP